MKPRERATPLAATAWISSLLLLSGLAPARAQSVDHQAMEQLFGEPITTSVTGKPQRVADAPANIEIITQDDIRRSGATSIPDVLAFVTGVDVRSYGPGAADVGIRGYNQSANAHLMVLINGRQVYMVDYGRILWASLPVQMDEIRQIEVIKGPNSALYGFNAVGGVINIITYDPLTEAIDTATLRGGTQGHASGSAVGTATTGGVAGLRLSAGGFESQAFAPGPLNAVDIATRRAPFSGNFNADGRWQVTPLLQVFLEASYGTMRLSQPSPEGATFTEQSHQWSVRAGLSAETALGVVSLSAYRNTTDLTGFAITQQFPFLFLNHEQQRVTVLEASDLAKIGTDHTIRIALEYRGAPRGHHLCRRSDVGLADHAVPERHQRAAHRPCGGRLWRNTHAGERPYVRPDQRGAHHPTQFEFGTGVAGRRGGYVSADDREGCAIADPRGARGADRFRYHRANRDLWPAQRAARDHVECRNRLRPVTAAARIRLADGVIRATHR